jgi:site-specific recombinase XerD
VSGPLRLADWDQISATAPDMVATMRRYLDQLTSILRPGSVCNADQALRSLATFLTEQAPEVTTGAGIDRRHLEDFRQWLAARPGRGTARVSAATLAHRLGTLRMFFVRLQEWDWADAPPRVPIIPADLPRQDHPLPKALDDPAAASLLRAAQTQPRMLVRVVVEVLLRTGLRVGEYTALRADAVMLIGAAHWLHVPGNSARIATCRTLCSSSRIERLPRAGPQGGGGVQAEAREADVVSRSQCRSTAQAQAMFRRFAAPRQRPLLPRRGPGSLGGSSP